MNFIFILVLLVFAVAPVFSVVVRLIYSHLWSVDFYGLLDIVHFFQFRKWRNCPYGSIKCYIAHEGTAFGTGKTLSAVKEISSLYDRFNGSRVWCDRRARFVTQRIHILSNVDLSIPFERLESLAQFVQETDSVNDYDDSHDCLTVTILFIDEASSQLNSRSFKSNFDPSFISRLLTSRHVRASLILTSQRSGMVDKLMRDCTNIYISCQKIWRFEILRFYDAYSVECASDPSIVAPYRRSGFFIKDSLFNCYDTYASVQALEKSCSSGDYLSESEILELRSGDPLQPAKSKRQAKSQRKKNKK